MFYSYGCEDNMIVGSNISGIAGGLTCANDGVNINGTFTIKLPAAMGSVSPFLNGSVIPGLPAAFNITYYEKTQTVNYGTPSGGTGICQEWGTLGNCYGGGTGDGAGLIGTINATGWINLIDATNTGALSGNATAIRVRIEVGGSRVKTYVNDVFQEDNAGTWTQMVFRNTADVAQYADNICFWTASGAGEGDCFPAATLANNTAPSVVANVLSITTDNQTLILNANATDGQNTTLRYYYTLVNNDVNVSSSLSSFVTANLTLNYANISLSSVPGNYTVIVWANDGQLNSTPTTSNNIVVTFPAGPILPASTCDEQMTQSFNQAIPIIVFFLTIGLIAGFASITNDSKTAKYNSAIALLIFVLLVLHMLLACAV